LRHDRENGQQVTDVIRALLFTLFAVLLASCAQGPRFLTYDGPEITEVRIHKAARRMELWHHNEVLHSYRIALGGNPLGHKERRGDSRTPEGVYFIDRRNPRSSFHLSLGISYPDADDRARAAEAGVDPGGDIFIHGRGPRFRGARGDWTDGCIAVRDSEIEHIYAMVRDGTRVVILP
jgi:murein L,D-transpeptidase YafK